MEIVVLLGILSTALAVTSCVAAAVACGAARRARGAVDTVAPMRGELSELIEFCDTLDTRIRRVNGVIHGSKGGRPPSRREPDDLEEEDGEFNALLQFQSAQPAPPK